MVEISDDKCCRVAHIFTKKCGRCKKLSLGVSLVPVNLGVPPLGFGAGHQDSHSTHKSLSAVGLVSGLSVVVGPQSPTT